MRTVSHPLGFWGGSILLVIAVHASAPRTCAQSTNRFFGSTSRYQGPVYSYPGSWYAWPSTPYSSRIPGPAGGSSFSSPATSGFYFGRAYVGPRASYGGSYYGSSNSATGSAGYRGTTYGYTTPYMGRYAAR
jgi:hypothetical protein